MSSDVRGQPRVLIVEDDSENRRLLRAALEGEGLVVVGEASNGEEALEIVQRGAPDVILMHVRMPGMGGIEAARLIKEVSPPAQVLMLTAYDGPLPTRSAQQVGAYAYLVKGCSAGLIRDVIMQAWKYGGGLRYGGGLDPSSAVWAPPA
jgi:CheY-like chemotaxis protein